MCDQCHAEQDDDYEGASIAEKRRKATRSIVQRHPELGIAPGEITFRFGPKAEKSCVRINLGEAGPRYEVHVPGSMGHAMSSGPSLHGIATAAFVASDASYERICDILGIEPSTSFDALFISEMPPVDPHRSRATNDAAEYETEIRSTLSDSGD